MHGVQGGAATGMWGVGAGGPEQVAAELEKGNVFMVLEQVY